MYQKVNRVVHTRELKANTNIELDIPLQLKTLHSRPYLQGTSIVCFQCYFCQSFCKISVSNNIQVYTPVFIILFHSKSSIPVLIDLYKHNSAKFTLLRIGQYFPLRPSGFLIDLQNLFSFWHTSRGVPQCKQSHASLEN